MTTLEQEMLQKRDSKAIPHLTQYAPVWIIEQEFILDDEAVQFNAVFQHPNYGWVSRRYRFDSFNNVLYHKGQNNISEDMALEVQEQAPYIVASIADIPNAYGG